MLAITLPPSAAYAIHAYLGFRQGFLLRESNRVTSQVYHNTTNIESLLTDVKELKELAREQQGTLTRLADRM